MGWRSEAKGNEMMRHVDAMDEWMGWMDGWMVGCGDGMDGWMGRTDGWMDGFMDGWVDGMG
jgi:hypothetical protein